MKSILKSLKSMAVTVAAVFLMAAIFALPVPTASAATTSAADHKPGLNGHYILTGMVTRYDMNCYSVRLCEKTGDGKYKVLARSLPKDYTTEPKSQELYQVRIIHLNNDEQVLHFPILAAAQATFELLKYELKVGRIRGAKIVRVIPSVGMKETLVSIGETEEEDTF